ncbi:MAG: phage portal protein, partial [Planctomycetia bacterium]|nr:phage portal protein [Planctomycetia bacterium]
HWFKPKRPGQRRAIPETTPGLPLFAQLRRYTLATLGAAEFAAMLAGIMKTDAPADGFGPVAVAAMDEIELTRGHLLTLPAGWSADQFDPTQPATTYKEFKGEILGEIGRGHTAPFNVISGNSSGYNYSSGRLDHLLYQRAVKVERMRLVRRILARVFIAWIREATCAGLIPFGLPPLALWSWKWHFDGFGSIDPWKDAQTNDMNLRNGIATLADILGEQGRDWEDAIEQHAREIAKYAALKVPYPLAGPAPARPVTVEPDYSDAV